MKIMLAKEWEIGEQIGSGGFGVVRAATSGATQAVAKFIPKAPGADRELLFVDVGSARNVVSILDSGEIRDSWVIVMARADMNLREYIQAHGPAIDAVSARVILTDIVTALVDLDGRVVHRDVKPENILLLDGHWCLADFGISRYAEATTAPDTLKFAMSPAYAAPERWRSERATTAADVYAVGVVGYELLAGSRPFAGPGREDLREQHLFEDAPALAQVDARLAALIEECLIKAPGVRPIPADLLSRLERVASAPASEGLAQLHEANRTQVNRLAASARRASEAASEAERRAELVRAGKESMKDITEQLIATVLAAAPTATQENLRDGSRSLTLGSAELRVFGVRDSPAALVGPGAGLPFDVVAYTAIGVARPADRYGYEGRSHSLWFCDAREAGGYAWFETAFTISAFAAQQTNRDPFALTPGPESAEALRPGMGLHQVAWPFTRLGVESLDEFIGRWAGWLANASEHKLHRSSTMPEGSPEGSWRGSS
jgi:hypothetical protein